MELRDLIVTPIIIFLVYAGAYWIRPYLTDSITRKYFIPALTVRIIGALAVGFIYQFYYDGGDTFNFHTRGSRIIWEAFWDDPIVGIKLLFSSGDLSGDVFRYAARIPFYRDSSSFAIIRLATLFDLITFSSYSATAVLFSVVSFCGLWLLYIVFYSNYRELHAPMAVACFFVPSVFFWGSGLLKDTITLASICFSVYCIHQLFITKRFSFLLLGGLFFSLVALYTIKIYILLILIPSSIIWVFLEHVKRIRGFMLKLVIAPPIVMLSIFLAGFSLLKASEDNPKYSLPMLAQTAKVTAYDIRYWTGRDAGSGYSLGELDGSFGSLLRLAPQAINVTLFRPYPWEVKNPLMVISSVESSFLLVLTLGLLIRSGKSFFFTVKDPLFIFSLVFSMVLAFGVGVSTYNFGTLSRYKIPLLPFFALSLILGSTYKKRRRKLSEFAATE